MALYHERPKKPSCFAKRGGHARPPKGDTFVNGAEGCVRETRKGVLHEDDPHFSELFEALKNATAWRKDFFDTLKPPEALPPGLANFLTADFSPDDLKYTEYLA